MGPTGFSAVQSGSPELVALAREPEMVVTKYLYARTCRNTSRKAPLKPATPATVARQNPDAVDYFFNR